MEIGPVYLDGKARFNLGGVAVVCARRRRRRRRRRRGVLWTVRQFIRLEALHRSAAGSLRACGERIGSLKNYIKQSNTQTIEEIH